MFWIEATTADAISAWLQTVLFCCYLYTLGSLVRELMRQLIKYEENQRRR